MEMSHINPASMASFFDTFHWVADRWKKQAHYSENKSIQKHYQTCPPPVYNTFKVCNRLWSKLQKPCAFGFGRTSYAIFTGVHWKLDDDEVFVAAEAVEIIIDIIEEVIGQRSNYIKELSQRWSDKIINMSFQHLRRWRNLRYQGVCTISQRIPHQYVATTFSGDPASKGECSVKWHNGNISVLVMVRGYNKIFEI